VAELDKSAYYYETPSALRSKLQFFFLGDEDPVLSEVWRFRHPSGVRRHKMSRNVIYYGRIVHSRSLKDLQISPKAALGVNGDGIIEFFDEKVNSGVEAAGKYAGFDGANVITLKPLQFLFPGLIDTHMHAPQWPNLAIGMEGDNLEWRENYTDPLEVQYKDTNRARRVYSEMVQKELENGSTTVAYNSTIHYEATNILSDMCLKYGQRAIVGKNCMLVNATHGNWEDSVEQSLEDEMKSITHIKTIDPEGKLVLPCVQPRGGSFVPPALMKGLGEMSHQGGHLYHVQTHMAETTMDVARMRKLHPDFHEYSDMYDHYGLLHEKCILAHCCHLSDHDIGMVAKRGAGISHNPNSNTCLRAGELKVRQLLDAGVKVGLGTDCSAGYSPSILDAMRQASNVSRHLVMHLGDPVWKLSIEEIIFLGTLGGAQVCGLQDKIGNFVVGKCFDALLIDVGLDDNINVRGWEQDDLSLVKKWVFLGDDRSIRLVWVNGKVVSGKDMIASQLLN
jgi:guanine deaminase